MFTKEKAAQYFVVAWVKDWTLRNYLMVISEGEKIDWEDAHGLFPWLPNAYWFFCNATTRRFVADCNSSLNNALWDATDNAQRLALAPRILALKTPARLKAHRPEAAKEVTRAYKALGVIFTRNDLDREHKERSGGHHWKVCK